MPENLVSPSPLRAAGPRLESSHPVARHLDATGAASHHLEQNVASETFRQCDNVLVL